MTRLRIEAVASGGDGIARLDGKAVFVPGAIPGDVAEVDLVVEKKRFSRGALVHIIEPSSDRSAMPCPHAAVCGGCTWQMVDRSVQLGWKQQAVEEALARIGGLDSSVVRSIQAPGPAYGYRNRLDLHPSQEGPGFFRSASHELVPIRVCLLAVPDVAARLAEVVGRPAHGGITIRAGVNTGASVVIGREHTSPAEAVITESVAGVTFRISGHSFFQPNTDGAEALVKLVGEASGSGGRFVDAFAGVGLFGATAGARFEEVVAIESNPVASRDLAVNLPEARVLTMPAIAGLSALNAAPSVIVVDPPRAGLGERAIDGLVAAGPDVIVSVSCDAATFARDARMLVDAGYLLEWVQPVDQFPQTPHIETVARFTR